MATPPVDLGTLIMNINPYPKIKTDMDIYVGNPNPPATPNDLCQVELMFDDSYSEGHEWTFRGEPQPVKLAARIRYRYPSLKDATGKVLCWTSDYLLIGFEGSGGP
jgi:hypothetical protein